MSREDDVVDFVNRTSGLGGEYWECGAFRGDLALYVAVRVSGLNRTIRVFDTFSGQPFSGPYDTHKIGSMAETSYEMVNDRFAGIPDVHIHKGIMPMTFSGLEDASISVANIDVDNYDSVKACLEFVYPRVHSGGYVIVDDYWCRDCPGAKKATDDFMRDKPESILGDGGTDPRVHFMKL